MTTKEFRSAVFARILDWQTTAFPNLPVITENSPGPDQCTIGSIWLDCEVRWYGASNITLGESPIGRHTGAVAAMVYFRRGEGTAQPDDIVDGLIALLKNKHLGRATLQFPQRVAPTDLKGWYKVGILVPFYLDGG